MYIRLAQGRVDPSNVDEAQAILREGLPAMKQLPGFQNAYLGTHRESGRGFTLSMWDTEEHASYRHSFAPGTGERLRALGLQVEPLTVYEVTDWI
jgi:heme-degrading monooxygenase HmoA